MWVNVMIGIYKITNTINNKIYIGQSVNIQERISEHKRLAYDAKFLNKFQYPLYLALNKYGVEKFTFEIIMECKEEELNYWEQYWIEKLNTYIHNTNSQGYNLTRGGDGHRTISQEQIEEIITLWNEGLSTGDISLITEIEKHAIIRYLKENTNYTVEESNKRGHINSSIHHQKVINIYNKYGKLIYNFNSVKEAGEKLNILAKEISAVVSNRKPSLHGMFFLDINEDQVEGLINRMQRQKPPAVIETNEDNTKILNIFFTKDDIKRYLQRDQISSVQPCCKGHCKSAYGHYWMYLHQYIKQFGLEYSLITEDGFAEEKIK